MTAVTELEPEPAEEWAEANFQGFFEENYQPLLRAMYLVTGDRYEAEDVVQEAFVRVYERWDKVRPLTNPAGYLYRTALNTYRNRLRRLAGSAKRALRLSEIDPISESDDRDAIRRALATLPEGQREAIVLVEWLGMTDEQAGQVLGVAPVTVRVRISRARQALQDQRRDDRDE